jgi:hypothetical protein
LGGGAHLDVRFELEDGTKLPHDVDVYDAAAGVLAAWVRVPLLSQQGATRLVVYYGKADLAAPEADPAAVWADYLAVWHLPNEGDRGPAGRHLASVGAVGSEPGGLAGASSFAGAGVLRRDDAASWMNGLPALTVQLRARAESTGHEDGVVNCGGFGSDGASALTVRYAGAAGALHARLATTAGVASLTTRAGAQSAQWQNLALAWAAGDARLGLFLDGRAAEAEQAGEIATGAGTLTAIAGALVLGAGSRDTDAGGWHGGIDEVRVRARKLPAGWLAAEALNQAALERFLGVGAEDSADDLTQSPVAVPFNVSTPVNERVDVDVLAGAVSAPGPNPTVLSAVGQPASGVASVIAGKVRYTPTTGFTGTDSFTYTLGAGAKRSTARITVQVGQQQTDVPVPTDPIGVANAAELRLALGRVRPGRR